MSEEKLRRALENCTKDAVQLRKKINEIEKSLEESHAQSDKAKRALKNCLTDVVDIRKKMRAIPAQRVQRRNSRSPSPNRRRMTSRKRTNKRNKRAKKTSRHSRR